MLKWEKWFTEFRNREFLRGSDRLLRLWLRFCSSLKLDQPVAHFPDLLFSPDQLSTFDFWSEKGKNMRGKESLTSFLYCGVFLDSLQISRISDCCGVKHKTKVVQNSNSRKESKDSCSRIYNVWKSDDQVVIIIFEVQWCWEANLLIYLEFLLPNFAPTTIGAFHSNSRRRGWCALVDDSNIHVRQWFWHLGNDPYRLIWKLQACDSCAYFVTETS